MASAARSGDVAGAVELGRLAAVPELVQRDAFAFQRGGSEFFRHNGVATAYSRESGSLREAAELDGAFLRSLYLIDGVGARRLRG